MWKARIGYSDIVVSQLFDAVLMHLFLVNRLESICEVQSRKI